MIMTYDESFVGGDPGPVASYNWVERSIIHALTEGVRSDQIVLGIAQYGRYWKDGEAVGGYGISNRQVEKLISQYGVRFFLIGKVYHRWQRLPLMKRIRSRPLMENPFLRHLYDLVRK